MICSRYQLLNLSIGLATLLMVSGKPITKANKVALLNSHFQTLRGKSVKQLNQQTGSKRVRLYSRLLGKYVRITGKTISALTTTESDDTIIHIQSFGKVLLSDGRYADRVALKSSKGLYICFDKTSAVVIEKQFTENCVFHQKKNKKGSTIFCSSYNSTWYFGFSAKPHSLGKPKLGHKTRSNQRSVRFMVKKQ